MAIQLIHISLKEFRENLESYFEQANQGKEFIIDNEKGEQLVIKRANTSRKKRKYSEEAHQAFLAAAGGWKDEDTDTLLENIYKSRNMNIRPFVDLD